MNDNHDDRLLMQRIMEKDSAALEQLYSQYERVIYAFAYRIVQDEMAAEEVMQELFLRIWNHAERYQSEQGKLTTWMFAITRNIAIDMLRRKSARNAASPVDDEVIHLIPDESSNTEQVVESRWLGLKVSEALAELSEEQKIVVDSIYYQGMTQHEVSVQYQIPLGTVKSRVRLAMKQLQRRLGALNLWAETERREETV
ncbi:sigma-70 family RNA polymerase sigma factor [Paenibacillus sp. F411]|uniref:RNA polymerase sigma factor n=1 Tax=Paenibacillus sp. F411 TaxID=2820239 RepID=UPI001AAE63A3|nr:sigma-70 family RNA polymerase sigma factor [Paenibacillus sp. F411]MBO2944046.1 sigma-70 family RNA polymerase sigma factor [Paenibacillus sp. F411]